MADVQNDYNILIGTLDLIGIKYSVGVKSNTYKTIILKQDADEIYLYFTKDGMYNGG